MNCVQCGTDVETGARFCSRCGRALLINEAQTTRLGSTGLVRPRESRMIAGVCAGFAHRYGWDVVVVRLITLLSVLFAGVPLIAYVIAWIVMPNEQYALPAQAAPPLGTQPGAGPGSISM